MIFEKIREKIRERLEEEKQRLRKLKNDTITLFDSEVIAIKEQSYNFCKEIVNQVEAEYNNGWIPCSERLPEGEDYVLAQYADGKYIGGDDIWMAFYNHTIEQWEYETDEGLLIEPKVIAWMPLPKPYTKGE